MRRWRIHLLLIAVLMLLAGCGGASTASREAELEATIVAQQETIVAQRATITAGTTVGQADQPQSATAAVADDSLATGATATPALQITPSPDDEVASSDEPAPATTSEPLAAQPEHVAGVATESMTNLNLSAEPFASLGDPDAPITMIEFSDYG
jgi:hypothetical protein